ncbi:MAG: NAD(P)/FAD-dependent oxidoreductase [Flavobacteriaceae bacterium]|nr:NAD(P)/FAD-dependent oxidoreductase [Flavobacteriaceae bacterium]
MKNQKEVLILGGGLAGLTAAIHLSKLGLQVMVIEKNGYPKHKVCGEYISNEVLPYFEWLGIDILKINPTLITKLQFSTQNGTTITTELPLGGFGISRYALDFYLYNKAIANGCIFLQETVENVIFDNDEFTITTSIGTILKSKIVIGAFGKRSAIDVKLNRNFILKKSHWLAVKAHYTGDFPNDLVGLHNFNGGYCGVSKVENNAVNICYITNYETYKLYKNNEEFQKLVLSENQHLKILFEKSTLIFEKPLTIGQISFDKKEAVKNHILMIGDTAGLIHPLCGNGMAMAIHSAKIASELVLNYYDCESTSRATLEKEYVKQWKFNFEKRLKTGRFIANLLQQPRISSILMRILVQFPFLLLVIIKKTHGKPIL